MKHTPGPWIVGKPAEGRWLDLERKEDRLIYTEDKLHIAETFQYQDPCHCATNGTSIANASLIAAAPDMLAALKLAEKYLIKVVVDALMEDCAMHPSRALQIIEETINKAEGKGEREGK